MEDPSFSEAGEKKQKAAVTPKVAGNLRAELPPGDNKDVMDLTIAELDLLVTFWWRYVGSSLKLCFDEESRLSWSGRQ